MDYLPIFADVRNKTIVIAGGSQVAVSKLRVLLKTKAKIHVFASKIDDEILRWEQAGLLQTTARALEFGDLENADILYSAYYSEKQNTKIAAMGKAAGVWVNVVDGPALSDFISPAIVDRDPVVVAIGTEGAAPVLARKIKAEIEESLAPNLGLMARVAKSFRHAVEALPFGRARRDYWSAYYAQDIQSEGEAQQILEESLREALQGNQKDGHVSFVGAGPGDPELLTLKARKKIDTADIVIYDRLVSKEILELARREATLIEVGKTGYGPSWKQEDINNLILTHAQKGELVVRLKGGDPSIYGRLDEEVSVLENAGVSYDVVPGITTATAAAASLGRSLTSRGRNSELRIITGRETQGYAEQDWRALAKNGSVAAIYMGAKAARFLQGRLLMHGANGETPVTVLSNVSRNDELQIATNLQNLPSDLETQDLNGPVIILFGISQSQAVQFHQELPNAAQI